MKKIIGIVDFNHIQRERQQLQAYVEQFGKPLWLPYNDMITYEHCDVVLVYSDAYVVSGTKAGIGTSCPRLDTFMSLINPQLLEIAMPVMYTGSSALHYWKVNESNKFIFNLQNHFSYDSTNPSIIHGSAVRRAVNEELKLNLDIPGHYGYFAVSSRHTQGIEVPPEGKMSATTVITSNVVGSSRRVFIEGKVAQQHEKIGSIESFITYVDQKVMCAATLSAPHMSINMDSSYVLNHYKDRIGDPVSNALLRSLTKQNYAQALVHA